MRILYTLAGGEQCLEMGVLRLLLSGEIIHLQTDVARCIKSEGIHLKDVMSLETSTIISPTFVPLINNPPSSFEPIFGCEKNN